MKRLLCIVLGAVMALSVLPVPALAVGEPVTLGDFVVTTETASGYEYDPGSGVLTFTEPGSYTVSMRSGVSQTTVGRIKVSGGTTADPFNITLDRVDINLSPRGGCAFSMAGATVNLILVGASSLISGSDNAGAFCPAGATLTIADGTLDGTGRLVARGDSSGAGIGGRGLEGFRSAGSIEIRGGEISALGGNGGGAGIGGGGGISGGSGGSIAISGGVITATGGSTGGAGIGGGGRNGGSGGSIAISGGLVTATGGGPGGAGIGGGLGGSGGSIAISSGVIEATGSNGGAGIGGGYSGRSGSIIISNGVITATGGGNGAGIGGGALGDSDSIVIGGGTVMATSDDGAAGIGGGHSGSGGSIEISNATVVAIAGSDGAGIGGGYSGSGGSIDISSGMVTATGGSGGAGIGGGRSGSGGSIDISNATVTATAGSGGAGVGGGRSGGGGSISIGSGTVIAAGGLYGAGIGGGYEGSGGRIAISSGAVTAAGGPYGAGIGNGYEGSGGSITIEAGTVLATGGDVPGGAGFGLAADTTVITGGSVKASAEGTVTGGPDDSGQQQPLGLVEAPLSGISTPTGIIGLYIPDVPNYGTADLHTDDGGKLYLWLPGDIGAARARTANAQYEANSGTFIADTAEPAVVSVTPSGAGAARSGSLRIVFSEVMRAASGAVSLTQDGMDYALAGGAWSVGNTVYTVDYSGLGHSAQCTIEIAGFQDYSGNAMLADNNHAFVTVAKPREPSDSPNYWAGVTGGSRLAVIVDRGTRNASVDVNSAQHDAIFGGADVTVTIPPIPDVDSYSVGIAAAGLSVPDGQGALTLNTNMGSIVIPASMLAGVGTGGSKAHIAIAQGDKSGLSASLQSTLGDRPLIRLSLSVDGTRTDWSNPGAPVTLIVAYQPTAEELANPEGIVVWYIDGSGNAAAIPNGHYDPESGTVTVAITHFSDYAVAYNEVSFGDVAPDAWYAPAVSFIAARGITNGTGDGDFEPAARLTRGEFIVLMMRAYDLAPDSDTTDNFADAGSTYYTGHLAAAKRLRISTGVGDNMYAPEQEITRQEMCTLLYNALKLIGQLPQGMADQRLDQYADGTETAPWAHEALSLFVRAATIEGRDGLLAPAGTATRAEMARVLHNLLAE